MKKKILLFAILSFSALAFFYIFSGDKKAPIHWSVQYGPRPSGFYSEWAIAVADGKKIAEVKVTKFTNETEGKYLIPKLYMEETHYLGEEEVSYRGILVYDTNKGKIIYEKAISGSKKVQFFPHGTCGTRL